MRYLRSRVEKENGGNRRQHDSDKDADHGDTPPRGRCAGNIAQRFKQGRLPLRWNLETRETFHGSLPEGAEAGKVTARPSISMCGSHASTERYEMRIRCARARVNQRKRGRPRSMTSCGRRFPPSLCRRNRPSNSNDKSAIRTSRRSRNKRSGTTTGSRGAPGYGEAGTCTCKACASSSSS